MQDISLHILDVVENSVAAQADTIFISIIEDLVEDLFTVQIIDNGQGMDEETINKVLDPFYTTKTVRDFGLGLPLLSEAAKAANGRLDIRSIKGKGTVIEAVFQHSHIDRKPMGDIAQTILSFVIGHPDIDLIFEYSKAEYEYRFATPEIKEQLKGAPLNLPAGMKKIREELAGLKI